MGNNVVGGGIPEGAVDEGGNTAKDPRFVEPAGADEIYGTADDDYHLSADSPAIDAGDDSMLPTDRWDLDEDSDTLEVIPVDLDGRVRRYSPAGDAPTVDIGAFEFGAPPVVGSIDSRRPGPGAFQFSVYPQPIGEVGLLAFTAPHSGLYRGRLIDILGRSTRMLFRVVAASGQTIHENIETSGLSNGAYILQISGPDSQVAIPILIIK